MEWEVSELDEKLEAELGRYFSDLQVLRWGTQGHLYHQCYWESECHLPEAEPPEKRISKRYRIAESPISVHLWGHEKVDDADP